MTGRELAVVQGWTDTRATLTAWNRAPWPVLRGWLALSGAIALGLLAAVWVVATIATPDPTPILVYGVHTPPSIDHALTIMGRNLLVLGLHSMACLAGFIAKTSLPREAEDYTGWWRKVHDHAGGLAIAFVGGATVFSLGTQAYALGLTASSLAPQMGTTPLALLLAESPHALLELAALFLPLAAWLIAARAEAWHELMAATITTTALALPALLAAAMIEAFVTPALFRALHFV